MKYLISLILAFSVKVFSLVFFRLERTIINETPDFWDDITVFAFLNHTSLFEPLLFSSVPNSFFYKNVKRAVLPGADITLERPIVGRLYKTIFPQIIGITRKRDDSWSDFMDLVKPGSLVVLAPEGRMMREEGLDKNGKPMSIKTGIADILSKTHNGYFLIGYSGGLHHVQRPGEPFIHLFKTIKITYERISIKEYKESLNWQEPGFHKRVVNDLTERMKRNIPK
ncbi:MAG: hypothetical protein K9K67_06530 [Bacteriovoracaceae bacterium]|nr:hypothetical protein [Bacteriovoracaceae bacterium]